MTTSPATSRSTATAGCWASRSTGVRDQPLRLPALHLRRRLGSARAEDLAADADHGQPGRHRRQPGEPRDRPARLDRHRRRARSPTTPSTASRRTATRTRSARCARRPTARCGSARATGRTTTRSTRWPCAPSTRRRCRARSSTSTATGTGCRAIRSARARPTSRRSARRSTPRASATRSASSCAGGTDPVVGDVGWNTTEEIDLSERGPQLRLAVLRGPRPHAGLQRARRVQAALLAESPHDTGPAYSYRHPPERRRRGRRRPAGDHHALSGASGATRGSSATTSRAGCGLRHHGGQITNLRDFAPTGFDGVDLELTPEGDLAYMHFTDGSINTARLERIVYNGNHPPPAVAHATPTAGSSPLPRRLQRRRVGRPRRRSRSPTTGTSATARRTPPTRTANHTYNASGGVHRHADRPRLARGGERGQPCRSSSTAPRRSPRSRRPRTARCSATACRCTWRRRAPTPRTATLPESAFAWHVLLHHGSHTHIGGDFTGGRRSSRRPATTTPTRTT